MKKLSPKLKNIISTAVITVAIAALAITCSVKFVRHTNYEVKYAVREDLFEIEHISDYSPSIKGTEGDAKIYKNFGKKNSVVLTKNSYETLEDLKAASLCIDNERFTYEPFENGKAMLIDHVDALNRLSTTTGVESIKNNEYDGFICSYENAKAIVSENADLKICPVEIELFLFQYLSFLIIELLLRNRLLHMGEFHLILTS